MLNADQSLMVEEIQHKRKHPLLELIAFAIPSAAHYKVKLLRLSIHNWKIVTSRSKSSCSVLNKEQLKKDCESMKVLHRK
jgi:hypothetical protein